MKTTKCRKLNPNNKNILLKDTIAVIGLPRSGTTWLGKILDSHPDTLYRHEPDTINRLLIPLFLPAESWPMYTKLLSQFEFGLLQPQPLKCVGKLPLFKKNYYSWPKQAIHNLSVYRGHLATQLGAEPYLTDFLPFTESQPRIVWKSIESLGRAGVIAHALKPCRLIHLVRHPCGQVNSMLNGDRIGHFQSSLPLHQNFGVIEQMLQTPQAAKHGLNIETLQLMRPIERMAWVWVVFNDKALDELDSLKHATTVIYDDFCQNPIRGARSMLEGLGLSWHPQVEQFLSDSISAHSSRFYSVRKDPIRASNRWIQSMTQEDIDCVMEIASFSRTFSLFKSSETLHFQNASRPKVKMNQGTSVEIQMTNKNNFKDLRQDEQHKSM